MIDTAYIYEILGGFEGRAIAYGYVPCKGGNYTGVGSWEGKIVYGASGVTIGSGVDLGQQSADRLRSMGVHPSLVDKLAPYCGLQKTAALKKLGTTLLSLTPEEVTALDTAVKARYLDDTAARFGRDLFADAPKQVQAVATSLIYQFGSPSNTASPGLTLAWKAMQQGDYATAAGFLRNESGWSMGHRQYMNRRRQEAVLLDQISSQPGTPG